MFKSLFPLLVLAGLVNFSSRNDMHLPAIAETNTIERSIQFSGYDWKVRDIKGTQGPGPNYFNDKTVWVDSNGYLHLQIIKDTITGNWLCAEITSGKSFGYGIYEFVVEGAIDQFDLNIVLGLFNYSGNDGLDEMDIEFSRWGTKNYPNLNYTVWPTAKGLKTYSFTQEFSLQYKLSTHRFIRNRDSVVFVSTNGPGYNPDRLIAKSSCTAGENSVSRLLMPVHINFWLFDGHPPANQQPVEIIIRSFSFKS